MNEQMQHARAEFTEAKVATREQHIQQLLAERDALCQQVQALESGQAAALKAALDAQREELEQERRADERWGIEEHKRAWEAIQQSEGDPTNVYASFQERVWWRAAQESLATARQQVQALKAEKETLVRKVVSQQDTISYLAKQPAAARERKRAETAESALAAAQQAEK